MNHVFICVVPVKLQLCITPCLQTKHGQLTAATHDVYRDLLLPTQITDRHEHNVKDTAGPQPTEITMSLQTAQGQIFLNRCEKLLCFQYIVRIMDLHVH